MEKIDDKLFHTRLNLARGIVNKNRSILGLAEMAELTAPNLLSIFMCQYGQTFFEVKAWNISELKQAIAEETELGPSSFAIQYRSHG